MNRLKYNFVFKCFDVQIIKTKNIEKKYSSTWYDWLVKYIPEPIRKISGGFKVKVVILFNTNTPKQTMYGRGKELSKPKTQKKSWINQY